MEKISVYFNPLASNTGRMIWEQEIRRQLFRSELSFYSPQNKIELKESLNRDLERGIDVLISVGGDGTVNTLIQYLVGHKVGLLVIPAGTANDLAGELTAKDHLGLSELISSIRLDRPQKIDVLKINNRYMVTSGGLGLASMVAKNINQLRQRFPTFKWVMQKMGKNIYSLFLGLKLLGPSTPPLSLKVESQEFSGIIHCSFFMVNNQSTIAGSFQVAPHTSNADGKFNITILKHKNRFKLIQCILKLSRGMYPHLDPDLVSFESQQVIVSNLSKGKDLVFFGDGEIFAGADEYHIGIHPGGLLVYRHDSLWCDVSYHVDEDIKV